MAAAGAALRPPATFGSLKTREHEKFVARGGLFCYESRARTTFGMSSREGTPSSNVDVDVYDFDENLVTDSTLKNLLKREVELQLQIDALQTEILQLEERLSGDKNKGNEEELEEQGK